MNITIKITDPAIVAIDVLPSIIGATVTSNITGGITIAGKITEITTDDGTIIDRESIIIAEAGIKANPSIINGGTAREGAAPRGSLIQSGIDD